MATTTDRRRTSSAAQIAWRKQVEEEIKLGTCRAFKDDWTNIRPPRPKNGQITPTYFNLKPLACFVPHLLIKNHVPCCPKSKSQKFVHVDSFWFAENSKPLFGLTELHTGFYSCTSLGVDAHTFIAHHPDSLRLGGPDVLGIFRFMLPKVLRLMSHSIILSPSNCTPQFPILSEFLVAFMSRNILVI